MEDVAKFAVYDARIVQHKPKYAVEKGPDSITNQSYTSVGANTSQVQFNPPLPSTVFLDRLMYQSVTTYLQTTCVVPNGTPNGEQILVFGRDAALCAFPFMSMVSNFTVQVNNEQFSLNAQNGAFQILSRLADCGSDRRVRTCPNMLDVYQSNNDGYLAINTPLASWLDSTGPKDVPNGAWWNLAFTDAVGNLLSGTGSYVSANGSTVNYVAGTPIVTSGATSYQLYIVFNTKEPIFVSPLIWADAHEWSTGLFGVKTLQITESLSTAQVSRVLRYTTGAGRALSGTAFNAGMSNPVQNAVLNVLQLTPSYSLPLPPKSIIPTYRVVSYPTNTATTIAPGATATQAATTITLPNMPSLIVIAVRPTLASGNPDPTDAVYADWYLPISNVSIILENNASLLTTLIPEQLHDISVKNGLKMDFLSWNGQARSANTGGVIPTVGGFLVLRPGPDLKLAEGLAPGLTGNYTLNVIVTYKNTSTITVQPSITILTLESGYCVSSEGQSKSVWGVLTQADVLGAAQADFTTREQMKHLVGGGFLDTLSSAFGKAKDIFNFVRPGLSAAKDLIGLIPHPVAQGIHHAGTAIGLGDPTNGGSIGAGRRGRRRAS